MRIIRKEDTFTREWSGGTTTELAIAPEGAAYADRDFLWRLSTAEVLDETSTFTKLPDYHRFLTIRKGELKIKHDDGEWYTLNPGEVTEFDGGALTLSEGRVTDFNLMVRKGSIKGSLFTVRLSEGESFDMKQLGQLMHGEAAAAVYVSEGGAAVINPAVRDGGEAAASGHELFSLGEGDMLMIDSGEPADDMQILAESASWIFIAQMCEM